MCLSVRLSTCVSLNLASFVSSPYAPPAHVPSSLTPLTPTEALRDEAPFSAIHVGAAAEELPKQLLHVLKPGGRMVVPVGRRWESQVGRAGLGTGRMGRR